MLPNFWTGCTDFGDGMQEDCLLIRSFRYVDLLDFAYFLKTWMEGMISSVIQSIYV